MSRRTAKERRTSRTGQIHLCAVCVEDGGGYGSAGQVKQLTWMLEIPPDSDTCARLGGRPRTWFCRSCIEATFAGDPIFADRNRHLELEDPDWWTEPASSAQITYLTALLDQREVPKQLQQEIETAAENATKGQVSRWLSLLDIAPWLPRTADDVATPRRRDIVH